MKITSAEFVTSAVDIKSYPSQRLPEIAFVGRSNVGKSSLINKLVNRKKLVKVSNTPGRTQTINFFLINQAFYYVDLPGYGYAKVPKAIVRRFGPMIECYIEENPYLACVVQILDTRHKPTQLDLKMREYLLYHGVQVLTVSTKSDKLPLGKRKKQKELIRKTMGLSPEEELILFSTITSEGKRDIEKVLQSALNER